MYPTFAEVENADRETLARWHRFLPSPGSEAVGRSDFVVVLQEQALLLGRIETRFRDLGGMSPEISRKIGWNPAPRGS